MIDLTLSSTKKNLFSSSISFSAVPFEPPTLLGARVHVVSLHYTLVLHQLSGLMNNHVYETIFRDHTFTGNRKSIVLVTGRNKKTLHKIRKFDDGP